MQVNWEGIWFNYYGDQMMWRWWWNRIKGYSLYSTIHDRAFKSKLEYWKFVGAIEESTRKYRVRSYDHEAILVDWVGLKFPSDHIVILHDINVSAKEASFWLKLPQHYRPHFLGDYVVLTCGSGNEVFRLCDSIPRVFAQAFGFSGGKLVYWNEEETIKEDVSSWEETPLGNMPL